MFRQWVFLALGWNQKAQFKERFLKVSVVHKINPTYTFKDQSDCIKDDDSNSGEKCFLYPQCSIIFSLTWVLKGILLVPPEDELYKQELQIYLCIKMNAMVTALIALAAVSKPKGCIILR